MPVRALSKIFLHVPDFAAACYRRHVAAALPPAAAVMTRQLSYRKEDRAMRPIYGCPEKFSDSSLRTRLLFQKFVMDFCSDRY